MWRDRAGANAGAFGANVRCLTQIVDKIDGKHKAMFKLCAPVCLNDILVHALAGDKLRCFPGLNRGKDCSALETDLIKKENVTTSIHQAMHQTGNCDTITWTHKALACRCLPALLFG